MAKVVEKTIKLGKTSSVKTKWTLRSDGKSGMIRVIDINSPTLMVDITDVFQKNVAKARRANEDVAYQMGWSGVNEFLSNGVRVGTTGQFLSTRKSPVKKRLKKKA